MSLFLSIHIIGLIDYYEGIVVHLAIVLALDMVDFLIEIVNYFSHFIALQLSFY